MIISASRRTDIPALYGDWFINRLKAGFALVPNPMNPKSVRRVDLTAENVDIIVFWSKNPAPILDKLSIIDDMGYKYYFTFSLTPYGKKIEPNLPPKTEIIKTFMKLSEKIGKDRVDWRYDPILLGSEITPEIHFENFDKLCAKLSGFTERCIISFADTYRHLGTAVAEIPQDVINETARGLSEIAKKYNLPLYACSEAADFSGYGINRACCINREKIEQILGRKIKAGKDSGQRAGCGCVLSADVGVYSTCTHGCKYCYAVKSTKTLERNLKGHSPDGSCLTEI
ncbi:MAG: DUF1848 domain-containing protein [Clostridiales bacterium]|jgi:DNA repair photolyase|nr:DUF1848 domain-containing protein [Clostridiales bacterium]